jgi:hypothetical protein
MELTPGLSFLARNLGIPSIMLFFIHRAASTFGFVLSLWTILMASIAALIVFVVGHNFANRIFHARDAKRMGARLAPRLKGNWPGNFDFISKILESYETGYLGGCTDGYARHEKRH